MDLFCDLPEPKNTNYTVTESVSIKKRSNEDDNELSNKKLNSGGVQTDKIIKTKAFFADKQGERDSMQDRHVIIENFLGHLTSKPNDLINLSFYAIFDGHAGARAAEFCAENLHVILAEKFSKAFSYENTITQIEKDMKRFFVEAFKQCDDEFLKKAAINKPSWKDGTTVTVILIFNKTLFSANIGDSKAIICKSREVGKSDQIIELTKEHSAFIYEERQRIQKQGGQVRDGRVLGVLEVSRSIGDGPFKAYGVTCMPDLRKCQLNYSYKYIILACDGLWKSFTNEEANKLVNEIVLKQKKLKESENNQVYEECCRKLAVEAVKKLSADNVTVMLIKIEGKDE